MDDRFLVDGEVHFRDGGCRDQFMAQTTGGRPDKQVGRGFRIERLYEYLVAAPFDLVRRASRRDFGDRLRQFNDARMVWGRFDPDYLVPVRLFRLDSLGIGRERSEERRVGKERRSRWS